MAANHFDGSPVYDPADIRDALDVDSDVPVLLCDARRRESVREVLVASVAHALTRHQAASRR